MTAASATLNRCDIFPVGTVVAAYRRVGMRAEGGPPQAEAAATATVAADGSLTFTGLDDPADAGLGPLGHYVPYAAYAEVAGEHRWVLFRGHRWPF